MPCPGSPASRTTKRTRRTRRTAQLPTPAGTELAAYRVIQEALTNVTKHAAVDTARVRLAYRADDLLVTVANDGTAHVDSHSPSGGYGLIGMRERTRSARARAD